MEFLWILPILLVLLLAYMRYEAGHVEVTRINVIEHSAGLKVMVLADLHLKMLKVPASKVKKIIDKEDIDVLLLVGDYIDKLEQIPSLIEYLSQLKGRYRIFLTFGNHDHMALMEKNEALGDLVKDIQKLGIEVLLNKTCPIVRNGKYYNIIGIDDLRSGRADIKKALESRYQPSYMDIAFAHNPDTVLMFPRGEVDYVMSGHFHGGQVWMPFKFEFMMLRNDVLCKRGITRGLHKVNDILLYISRGLGNVILPLRFMSRPEITVFRLP